MVYHEKLHHQAISPLVTISQCLLLSSLLAFSCCLSSNHIMRGTNPSKNQSLSHWLPGSLPTLGVDHTLAAKRNLVLQRNVRCSTRHFLCLVLIYVHDKGRSVSYCIFYIHTKIGLEGQKRISLFVTFS